MLTERYRPRELGDLVGQPQAVKTLLAWAKARDRGALMFVGPSGCGKTSAAYALAREVKVDPQGPDFFKIEAAECNLETVQWMNQSMWLHSWNGAGWRVWLIDEAHTMSKAAQNRLLTLLEKLPPRRIVVCTTTQEAPFNGDTVLFSRFTKVYFKPISEKDALARLREICYAEVGHVQGLDLKGAVAQGKGNLREAIQQLDSTMLERGIA